MGRGNGKTTFAAGISCAAVDVDGPLVEPMAECLLVASSFDQGLIAFRHMLHFLQPSFEKHGVGPGGRFRIQDSANQGDDNKPHDRGDGPSLGKRSAAVARGRAETAFA